MKKALAVVVFLALMYSGAWAISDISILSRTLPDATVGSSYNQQFTALNAGPTGVDWSWNGYIPGMTFASGTLSGTPTQANSYSFKVTARRRYGTGYTPSSDTKTFTLKVNAKGDDSGGGGGGGSPGGTLSVGGFLEASSVGEKYPKNNYGELYAKATANGGTPPYKWSVVEGDLPIGVCLACSPTGLGYRDNVFTGPYTVLSGIPALGGMYNFTLKVTDSTGQSATKDFSINVKGGNLDEGEITGYVVGAIEKWYGGFSSYSEEDLIYVSKGMRSPFEWSKIGGTLPSGVKVSTKSNGRVKISGTPSKGKYHFVLKVTDTDGRSAKKAFSVTYGSDTPEYGLNDEGLSIPQISGSFAAGTAGKSYSATATVSNGKAPYTWSVSYGALPDGVTLTGTTGQTARITGTPTAEGVYNFVLKVEDANGITNAKTFVIKVEESGSTPINSPTAPTITTTSLPDGTKWRAYSAQLTALGTTPITWLASGLPMGLSCSTEGKISGNPSASGSFTVRVTATNSEGSVTKTIPLTINASSNGTIAIDGTLKLPTVGESYSDYVTVNGGEWPYTWTVHSGTLPPGLSMNGNKPGPLNRLYLEGELTRPGHYTFELRVEDFNGNSGVKSFTMEVVWLLSAQLGQSCFERSIPIEEGKTFTKCSRTLPTGLTMRQSGSYLWLTGMPTVATEAGTYEFEVQLKDAQGKIEVIPCKLEVKPQDPLKLHNPASGTVGKSYSGYNYINAAVSGGIPPYTWTKTRGTIPPGLNSNFSGEYPEIKGTPTKAGTYTFEVKVKDADGCTAVESLDIVIHTSMTITTMSLASGKQGSSYSTQLTANGLTTPITWSASGLPAGLSCSSEGKITGTPTQAGTFDVKITATNSLESVTKNLELIINAPATSRLSIYGDLNFRRLDWDYVSSFVWVSGGSSPYVWTHTSGIIPPGVSISPSSSGEQLYFKGNFKKIGSYGFELKVEDASGNVAVRSFTVYIGAPSSLRIRTTSLSNGTQGSAYSTQLTAEGQTPITWSASGLPAGLSCSSEGLITGTPTKSGSFDVKITAKDPFGGSDTKTLPLSISAAAAPMLAITTTSLPGGKVGSAYSTQLSATGASSITWSATGLPEGLSCSSAGLISGTPSESGSFDVKITATSSGVSVNKTLPLRINARPASTLTINWTFKKGTVGASYSDWVNVSGGNSPYTWTKTSGTLPPGLSMSPSGRYLYLKGTPSEAGTYEFALKVEDADGNTGVKSFTLEVVGSANPLAITTTSLPNGTIGSAYSAQLTATGATPITWSATGLPTGLSCSTAGKITGTPIQAGSFSVKVTATSSAGTVTKTLPLKIAWVFLDATVGVSYSNNVGFSGGTLPLTWTKASGTLPPGLSFRGSGYYLYIEGTPTKAGTYTFELQAKDANNEIDVFLFSLKVVEPDPPAINWTFKDTIVGASYSDWVSVSGGVSPYTWTKSSGTLPAGLKLTYSGTKATLSGTPTKAGTFTFKLKVTDKNKATATKSFTVNISKPEISGTLANGKLKAKYSKSLTVSGGVKAYTWKVSSGSLPTGLKLTYSGTKAKISGTPTKAGTFKFTLKVTDANGATATKSFTVKITKPTISGTLPNGTLKTKYSATLKVSSGTATYTWVKSSGTLPTGLKLTSSNTKATISGKPTKTGTFTFKLKVTDANGATATKSFTIKITKASSSSSNESTNETGSPSEKTQSEQTNSPETLDGEDTDVSLYAELKVVSEDIVEAFEGKDGDMVKVKAGVPLRFEIGDWGTEVYSVVVYVDDKPATDVEVSDEGEFTLPAERVHDDFKVGVKAQSATGERESEELFIIAE